MNTKCYGAEIFSAMTLALLVGCSTGAPTETSVAASEATPFTEHGNGFRADSASHRLEISGGTFTLTGKQRVGQESAQSLAVALETVAARRGGLALDVTVLESGLAAPDVVETVRTDFIEWLRNTSAGAEQSWRFGAEPGVSGDLTVEVEANQVAYLSSGQEGLLFERPNVLRMSYGHGVWIDADGDRWAIPAQYVAGRISLTVPAQVIDVSSFPAVLDPQIIVTPIGGTR